MTEAEQEKDQYQEVKRGPGRPRKPKDDQDPWPTSVPRRSPEKGRTGSDMASETQRGKSVGASSRKRGVKYIDQARSEATIDLPYLATCDPPVRPIDLTRMIQRDKKIPEPTLKLLRALRSVPLGAIPTELRAESDTPRKSNVRLDDSAFLSPTQKARYPAWSIPMLKKPVDLALRNGALNQRTGAHKRQWGALAHLLLCQAEYWYNKVKVLNVENVAIQPGEMRPRRPGNGVPIILDEIASKSEDATSTVTEYGDAMAKMVDWSIGIELEDDDEILITSVYANLPDNLMSINQTLSYIRNLPLIFDLEVKKTVQPSDPVVQIAIWASASLLKKRQHGWDTSMPSPAVTVDGHTWKYCIFFELNAELKMAGPFDFGSMAIIHGIWDILHRLYILMEWGRTDYRKWIGDHILTWARKISQPERVAIED